MRPELKLVKSAREGAHSHEDREIRFRYPADEEVWEVSCGGMEDKSFEGPGMKSRSPSRRAS